MHYQAGLVLPSPKGKGGSRKRSDEWVKNREISKPTVYKLESGKSPPSRRQSIEPTLRVASNLKAGEGRMRPRQNNQYVCRINGKLWLRFAHELRRAAAWIADCVCMNCRCAAWIALRRIKEWCIQRNEVSIGNYSFARSDSTILKNTNKPKQQEVTICEKWLLTIPILKSISMAEIDRKPIIIIVLIMIMFFFLSRSFISFIDTISIIFDMARIVKWRR